MLPKSARAQLNALAVPSVPTEPAPRTVRLMRILVEFFASTCSTIWATTTRLFVNGPHAQVPTAVQTVRAKRMLSRGEQVLPAPRCEPNAAHCMQPRG